MISKLAFIVALILIFRLLFKSSSSVLIAKLVSFSQKVCLSFSMMFWSITLPSFLYPSHVTFLIFLTILSLSHFNVPCHFVWPYWIEPAEQIFSDGIPYVWLLINFIIIIFWPYEITDFNLGLALSHAREKHNKRYKQ